MSFNVKYTKNGRKNLKETETEAQPEIVGIPSDGLYTLLMIDPDARTSIPGRYYLHWIVTNIPQGDIHQGQEYVPYKEPTPPSGIHNYHFILYRQTGSLVTGLQPSKREEWGLQEFLRGKPLEEVARQIVKVTHV